MADSAGPPMFSFTPINTGPPEKTAIILCSIFPAIAILAVVLRWQARRIKNQPFHIDDWLVVVACIFSVGNAVSGIIGACLGDLGKLQPLGPDGYALPSPNLTIFRQSEYANELLFVLAITFSKLSILFFYKRLFASGRTNSRAFNWGIYLMLGINVAWCIAFFLTSLLECLPLSSNWDISVEPVQCVGVEMFYGMAVSSVILDFLILIMPLGMIWRLQMPARQKIAVSGIFMLGFLIVAIGIAKTVAFYNVGALIQNDHQTTYDQAQLFYYTVAETCLAVLSACLPTLRPLFSGSSPESLLGSIRSRIFRRSRVSSADSGSTGPEYRRLHHQQHQHGWPRSAPISKPYDSRDWPEKTRVSVSVSGQSSRSSDAEFV